MEQRLSRSSQTSGANARPWVLLVDVDPYLAFLLERELGGADIVRVTRPDELDEGRRAGMPPACIATGAAQAAAVAALALDAPLLVVGGRPVEPTGGTVAHLSPPFTAARVRRALGDLLRGDDRAVDVRGSGPRLVPAALDVVEPAAGQTSAGQPSLLRVVAQRLLTEAIAETSVVAASLYLDEAGALHEVASVGLPPGDPAWFGAASPAGRLLSPGRVTRIPPEDLPDPVRSRPSLDWYATALSEGDDVRGLLLVGLSDTPGAADRELLVALGRSLCSSMDVAWRVVVGGPPAPASGGGPAGRPAAGTGGGRRDLGVAMAEYADHVSLLTGLPVVLSAQQDVATDADVGGVLFRAARDLIDLCLRRSGAEVTLGHAPWGGVLRVVAPPSGPSGRGWRDDERAMLTAVGARLAEVGASLQILEGARDTALAIEIRFPLGGVRRGAAPGTA